MLENNYANFDLLQVQHCPLDQESDFIFVSKEVSIYEADLYFTEKKLKNQKFDVMFITEMGDQDSQILGMITSSDANVIDQYLLLQLSLAFYMENGSLNWYFILYMMNHEKIKNYENYYYCDLGDCRIQFDLWQCNCDIRKYCRKVILFSRLEQK